MTNNSGHHDHSATNHQVYPRLVLYPIVKHLDLSRCPLLHKSLLLPLRTLKVVLPPTLRAQDGDSGSDICYY